MTTEPAKKGNEVRQPSLVDALTPLLFVSAAIGLGQMAMLILANTMGVLLGTLLISTQKFVPVTVETGGL